MHRFVDGFFHGITGKSRLYSEDDIESKSIQSVLTDARAH